MQRNSSRERDGIEILLDGAERVVIVVMGRWAIRGGEQLASLRDTQTISTTKLVLVQNDGVETWRHGANYHKVLNNFDLVVNYDVDESEFADIVDQSSTFIQVDIEPIRRHLKAIVDAFSSSNRIRIVGLDPFLEAMLARFRKEFGKDTKLAAFSPFKL